MKFVIGIHTRRRWGGGEKRQNISRKNFNRRPAVVKVSYSILLL
jgi:hypothetical protein